ncbi:SRPBCC family protein [Sediminibacterium soli]|uniref:SRPBCC family protein n=1 Tax=Sediminibacterium soli TaxID=2698829 RepID=UPI00137AD395|nr:SRPBCC family protein [Sediminibacterium soli]NCI45223.1 ATPase [Sediminibacterium soli]
MANQDPNADRELRFSRLLNAPRELVFKVWTSPEHVAKWWGPEGFTNTIHEMQVAPGGKWLLTMHGPDGRDYPNTILYREVIAPEKLSWWHGSDEPGDPNGFEVTVEFEDRGAQTLLTMRMLFATAAARDFVVREYGAIEGNKQTMDRLEAYLATV